jgi:hypothetical protein
MHGYNIRLPFEPSNQARIRRESSGEKARCKADYEFKLHASAVPFYTHAFVAHAIL